VFILIAYLHQDSVTVENVLYDVEGVVAAAAVGVPDSRLGELVAAVVSVKPGNPSGLTEKSLIARAANKYVIFMYSKETPAHGVLYRLPRFAVPVMIVIHEGSFGKWPPIRRISASKQ
jgi:acyl-CoA synthetase (AMP-forming)/AMP-acid ligase II